MFLVVCKVSLFVILPVLVENVAFFRALHIPNDNKMLNIPDIFSR